MCHHYVSLKYTDYVYNSKLLTQILLQQSYEEKRLVYRYQNIVIDKIEICLKI